MREKVLITGLGCVSPFGCGVDKLWQGLVNARSSISSIQRFDVSSYRTKIGAEIEDQSLSYKFGPQVNNFGRNTRFAIGAASEALSDSGLLLDALSTSKADIGICLGSGLGGIYYSEEAITTLRDIGPRGISPLTVPIVEPNSMVSQIAIKWQLTGPQFTISTACSSSAHAIGIAMDMIRSGRCSSVLTGGSEATMSPLVFAGFDRLRAMSNNNDTPTTACRPFAKDRAGFVMAEGAAMLLLESETSVKNRNGKVYAELLGYGANGGAHHTVMPKRDGEDLILSMKKALVDAKIDADQIDLISPHGTGTKLNDQAEYLALKSIYGKRLRNVSVTPTKQLTGHPLGAAGAFESIHIVKSIYESVITPIALCDTDMDLDIAVGQPRQRSIGYAMNNSFGFGNNNVSLVFGAYT